MHRVFVDSNVLGSKTQYDWVFLLRLETDSMFSLYTSDDVLDEAHRVWRRKYPEMGGEMRTEREKLFRTNFDGITSDWVGNPAPVRDVDDTHVHNAAVFTNVDILLTNNVEDFGDPDLLPYDIYTPDEFFCLIYNNDPAAVNAVAIKQAEYWLRRQQRHPDAKYKKLSDALVDAGCPEFSPIVYGCLQFLSGVEIEEEPASEEPVSVSAGR